MFASHNIDRDDENGIASDYVKSNVDYFAGEDTDTLLLKMENLQAKEKMIEIL